ncbi:enoyl-CoA hydratase-related protein [Photobacterium jeanii]|uniref:enoyl-CoA hydratase-related protein n=1 Tax=Photobacterium jeanii TaxID=858640 RepID=UPI0018DC1B12|nr:enoyl-CoA hydratase-related protein [Photobacterium jeanii]
MGVAFLTLNRTDKHNAFDDHLIAELIKQLALLSTHPEIRALVLQANGKHFSAGADLNWMRSMAAKTPEENQADAEQLSLLMHQLDNFPHPSLCLVQGAAYGGALGLICCCDMAIAHPQASFCLSEVKLGLIPATIGPYVLRAMGNRQARRYMLTAEIINAHTAQNLMLIHQLSDDLTQARQTWLQHILANSPSAVSAAKSLCLNCDNHPIDDNLRHITSETIATLRVSPEGQEGLNAFFEKRRPHWYRHISPASQQQSQSPQQEKITGDEDD